jgi:hypothetical protein
VTTATAETPAEYPHDYSPCCVLADDQNNLLATLPLGAWSQLAAWHRDPNARPLMIRDAWGQTVRFDRRVIARIYRRDLDSVVLLEELDRDRAAARLMEGE